MTRLSLRRIFSDGLVLQRGTENIVSGSAEADCAVKLKLNGENGFVLTLDVISDSSGRWSGVLPPIEGGMSSYTLEVSCKSEKAMVKSILFGDVFHISGQSNMELQVSGTYEPLKKDEFVFNDTQYIREFRVPVECVFERDAQYDDFTGGCWKSASGADIADMSAAGYYFALEILRSKGVPVGLVNTSAGGSVIEGRMPLGMLEKYGSAYAYCEEYAREGFMSERLKSDTENERRWYDEINAEDKISGLVMSAPEKLDFTECEVPFYFRNNRALDGFCGRIWFKKSFFIPDNRNTDGAVLILGELIDSDTAYINGVEVGSTGYMYPPRNYSVRRGVLRSGLNTLLVRLDVKTGCGGFLSSKPYGLLLDDGFIDLRGRWEYAVAAKMPRLEPAMFFQGLPTGLYASMTAPAFPIRFKALLWYQGESNCGNADFYKRLFTDFTNMYRERCGYEIPIIFTQLCNYGDPTGNSPEYSWSALRQAQLDCLDIPKTAMAVTIDIGDSEDLHPTNKRDVGKRLAMCAEKLVYGCGKAVFAARCVSAEVIEKNERGDIVIGLVFSEKVVLKNDTARYFRVKFGNGELLAAKVKKARENTLALSVPFCSEMPVAVKYAYCNDPCVPDLFDEDGLPVSPFVIDIL